MLARGGERNFWHSSGLNNLFPPHPAAIHFELEPAHRRPAEMPGQPRARGAAPHDLAGEEGMQVGAEAGAEADAGPV